ncbi:MAG: DUF748 domain-containing protein [Burkholderiales bacterium]|nr:DUF748 domain-containing protein [Phycisphaerae bacterium]
MPDETTTPIEIEKSKTRRRSRWRTLGYALLVLFGLLVIARLCLPGVVLWYVNRTIDRSPLYDGKVGDIDISLWRGAYTIKDIRFIKTTGNVPVPLFAAKRVDLAVQWGALANGKIVAEVEMDGPELNFVDAGKDSDNQNGADVPWLGILRDLSPFTINNVIIKNGSAHFRAPAADPPVDVFVNQINATVKNVSNIHDDVAPLVSTVDATARVMNQANTELHMKFDPLSYHPSFDLGLRLVGLDVTKTNDLARAYGAFDFESGYFDLVVEVKATQGQLEGYVKPLFRELKVLSLRKDIQEDNVIGFFWEALVGATTRVLRNPPRDQFGTHIPIRGDLTSPRTDVIAAIGNVLRNAFIRGYLPRLDHSIVAADNAIRFDPGKVTDAGEASDRK